MGTAVETETNPKVGLLQRLGQRLGISKTEQQREAEMRRYLARITPEPFEVVEQRLQQRLDSPEIRRLLAIKLMLYKELFYGDMGEHDRLLFYKTSIEIGSIQLFGKNHQELDFNSPLELNDKDMELVHQLEPVATSLRLGDKSSAMENLKQIPLLAGSKADLGKYDGYNREALIVTGTSSEMIQNMLNTKPNRIGVKTTSGLSRIIYGFEAKDRLSIVKGFTGLF